MLQHVTPRNDLLTRDDIPTLCEEGGIGVELGVWRGVFSDLILRYSKLELLFSIDEWKSLPGHYHTTKKKLAVHRYRNFILPMSFTEAARIIADDSLDFIYVDGEHDYDNVSRDIKEWWPKLRSGGIFSGHDYEMQGPFGKDFGVIRAVSELARKHDLNVFITGIHTREKRELDSGYSSWYLWK